jgi:hypothetical protein
MRGADRLGRPRSALAALGLTLALLAVASVGAAAEEVTRESYREAAEPICQVNTEANERILAGVRKEVKEGKLDMAGRRFRRAGAALRKTLAELKAVPRPSADRARLSRWLGFVAAEAELFQRTAQYLVAGRKSAALGLVVRLQSTAARANNVVFPFEFKYCRFEPSRFT